MPVCGLVLTLATPDSDPAALAALPGVTLGARAGQRVAVVVEADDVDSHHTRLQALSEAPACALMQVTFADFSDVGEVPDGQRFIKRSKRSGEVYR